MKLGKIKEIEDLKIRKNALHKQVVQFVRHREEEFAKKTHDDFKLFFSEKDFKIIETETTLTATYGDLKVILKYTKPYLYNEDLCTLTITTQYPIIIKELQIIAIQFGMSPITGTHEKQAGLTNAEIIEQDVENIRNYIINSEKLVSSSFKKFKIAYRYYDTSESEKNR